MSSCKGRQESESRSGVLAREDLESFSMTTENTQCPGCTNHCRLTIASFSNGQRFVSGNRCERRRYCFRQDSEKDKEKLPNIFEYKYRKTFAYVPLKAEGASRRDRNTACTQSVREFPVLVYRAHKARVQVMLSARSSHKIYESGMETIPSESVCYPAKLVHGHIENLISRGIKTIFYPDIPYEHVENKASNNHFNCPIVCSYPEVIKNNVENLQEYSIRYINPFMPLDNLKSVAQNLTKCFDYCAVTLEEAQAAVDAGAEEYLRFKEDIRAEGDRVLKIMEEKHLKGVVLAGKTLSYRPRDKPWYPGDDKCFGTCCIV